MGLRWGRRDPRLDVVSTGRVDRRVPTSSSGQEPTLADGGQIDRRVPKRIINPLNEKLGI